MELSPIMPFASSPHGMPNTPDGNHADKSDHRRNSQMTNILGRRVSWNAPPVPSMQTFFQSNKSKTVGTMQIEVMNFVEEKWHIFAERLCRRANSIRVHAALARLPEDVTALYDGLEFRTGVQLDVSIRRLYYEEFMKKASGLDTLHFADAQILIISRFGFQVSPDELRSIFVRQMGKEEGKSMTEQDEVPLPFEIFAAILCEIIRADGFRARNSKFKFQWRKMFPLDPESKTKQTWDVFLLFLLLYYSFAVPYSIALSVTYNSDDNLSNLDIVNFVLNVFFMLDVVLGFVTSYDHQGFNVTDFGSIAKHYLRTWFWLDLAGSFPFDFIVTAAMKGSDSTTMVDLSAMRALRMLKLVQAFRFVGRLNRLKQKESLEYMGSAISLAKSLFILIFTAHVLGCIFTMFIPSEPDDNWLLHYDASLMEAGMDVRYLTALYWAIITITTMGYGDVLPVTNSERIFTIFVALLGAVVFSQCMGTVASLISQVAGVEDRFQGKMRSVAEYFRFRDIPPDLRRKVRHYYIHCWKRSPVLYDEIEILRDLSTPLRSEILKSIGSRVHQVPMLGGFDPECVGFILSLFRRVIFNKDDIIYKREDPAREMYFVLSGKVKLTWNNSNQQFPDMLHGGNNYKYVSDEGTFGELALFPDILGRFRPETANADSWLLTYTLSFDDFQQVRALFPEAAIKLRELCVLKAIECKVSDPSLKGEIREDTLIIPKQRKIETCIEQLKSELLRHREASLLLPVAADGMREIYTVLRPIVPPWESVGNEQGEVPLQSMSCVFSSTRELLCIEHTVEGISNDVPKSLGFLIPGMSIFRVLRKDETVRYCGSWSKRQLFGCYISTFKMRHVGEKNLPLHSSSDNVQGSGNDSMPRGKLARRASFEAERRRTLPENQHSQIIMLTWSQKEFTQLRKVIAEWLGSTVFTDVQNFEAENLRDTTDMKQKQIKVAFVDVNCSGSMPQVGGPPLAQYHQNQPELQKQLSEMENQLMLAQQEIERYKKCMFAALFPSQKYSVGSVENARKSANMPVDTHEVAKAPPGSHLAQERKFESSARTSSSNFLEIQPDVQLVLPNRTQQLSTNNQPNNVVQSKPALHLGAAPQRADVSLYDVDSNGLPNQADDCLDSSSQRRVLAPPQEPSFPP